MLSNPFVTAVVSVNATVEIAQYHRNRGNAYKKYSTAALNTVHRTTPFRIVWLARRSTATFGLTGANVWVRPA